jgi:hypothetical protein
MYQARKIVDMYYMYMRVGGIDMPPFPNVFLVDCGTVLFDYPLIATSPLYNITSLYPTSLNLNT